MAATRVKSQDIGDGGVNTVDILDGAVTAPKLALATDPALENDGSGNLRVKLAGSPGLSRTGGLGVLTDGGFTTTIDGLGHVVVQLPGGGSGGLEGSVDGLTAVGLNSVGSDPAAPSNGNAWYNATDKVFRWREAGQTLGGAGIIFSNTGSSNQVSSTTAETDFTTKATLPANFLTAGRVIRVRCCGVHSTTATCTFLFRCYLGTIAAAVGAITSVNNASNRRFIVECTFVVIAAGASGRASAGGWTTINTGADAFAIGAHEAALDTTATNDVKVSVQMGTSSASNKAQVDVMTIEALN